MAKGSYGVQSTLYGPVELIEVTTKVMIYMRLTH